MWMSEDIVYMWLSGTIICRCSGVSVVSRWFLGGLLVVSWWCVGRVLVSCWFLPGVSVVSRSCLGGVSVCLGGVTVLPW